MYQDIIKDQVKQYLKKAESVYSYRGTMPKPKIKFSNRMTRALGNCKYVRSKNEFTLTFSIPFMEANSPEKFEGVVAHEVGHLVQQVVFSTMDHGKTFKHVMHNVLEVPEQAGMYARGVKIHNIPKQKRTKRVYQYTCTRCKEMFDLSPQRHSKINKGAIYEHNCGGMIRYTGIIKTVYPKQY